MNRETRRAASRAARRPTPPPAGIAGAIVLPDVWAFPGRVEMRIPGTDSSPPVRFAMTPDQADQVATLLPELLRRAATEARRSAPAVTS